MTVKNADYFAFGRHSPGRKFYLAGWSPGWGVGGGRVVTLMLKSLQPFVTLTSYVLWNLSTVACTRQDNGMWNKWEWE